MANSHGTYIWYELISTDPAAARAFYTDLVGWSAEAFPGMGGYTVLSAPDGEGVAGLMARPDGAAVAPGWYGYIGVDDVDAAVDAIAAAGGTSLMPAMTIPDVGRIAMVADPQGVPFYVMRGSREGESHAFDYQKVGHCSWNELRTPDLAGAIDFYTRAFGWTKGDVMPMGEMGDYQFIHDSQDRIGAMMGNPPGGPPPAWGFYFRVADIDVAAGKVTSGGGTIFHGPVEVPGGDHIIIGGDPQGAMFGIVGAKGTAA